MIILAQQIIGFNSIPNNLSHTKQTFTFFAKKIVYHVKQLYEINNFFYKRGMIYPEFLHFLFWLSQVTMFPAISKINKQSDRHPDNQAKPCIWR